MVLADLEDKALEAQVARAYPVVKVPGAQWVQEGHLVDREDQEE